MFSFVQFIPDKIHSHGSTFCLLHKDIFSAPKRIIFTLRQPLKQMFDMQKVLLLFFHSFPVSKMAMSEKKKNKQPSQLPPIRFE
jgi:hypothetical protein